jgi:tRNA(Ile)-lysidine synthase
LLTERNVGWIDDPGNADPASERVRARLALSDEPDSVAGLLDVARKAAAGRLDMGRRAADLIRRHACRAEPGLIRVDPAFVGGDDQAAAAHALRLLLAVTGGTPHLPDEAAARMLARRLALPPCRATLSRALVAARHDGIWLCRERRGLPEPRPVQDGMVWDGRYRISAPGATGGVLVAAAGVTHPTNADRHDGLPALMSRTARACRPVFSYDPSLSFEMAAEDIAICSAAPVLAPWAQFLPCFDLEAARAAAGLVGAPFPPDSPCAGHNATPA